MTVERSRKPPLLALAAATGALFGYLMAVSNDAISFIRAELTLPPLQSALVVSGLVAGALVGCVVAGRVADQLGRRRSLAAAGVIAAVGVLASSVATGLPLMLAGRLLAGVAVGMTSTITPLYLAELAPLGRRGTLLTSYQLFITVGILLAFGVGLVLSASGGWRWMFAIGVVPAVAQLVVASIVPPSPLFLVHQGDIEGARRSLHRLRPHDEAEAELRALVASRHDAPESRPRLFEPRFRPGVTVGLVMALMNALVGVGAVIYYSSDVFRTAGLTGSSGAETASLAVGGVNTLGALLSIWLTSRYGRRPLLTVGLIGIVVSLVVAGVTLMLPAAPAVGTVTVAAVLAYMVFFAISAGPLAWLLLAEVMPADVRARAASLATAANWGANLLVALLFPVVVGDPGIPARVGLVFVVFAVLSVGFLVYVRLRVPETKGRTLEAIEADLRQTSRRVA